MSIHATRAPTVPLTSYDTKRSSHLKNVFYKFGKNNVLVPTVENNMVFSTICLFYLKHKYINKLNTETNNFLFFISNNFYKSSINYLVTEIYTFFKYLKKGKNS